MNIIWKMALALAMVLASMLTANAQSNENQTFEERVRIIADSIEFVRTNEKEKLKEEIKVIDRWVSNGSMSEEEAQEKKLLLANQAAERINKKVSVWESELQQLVQDKVDGKIDSQSKKNRVASNSKEDKIIEFSVNKFEKRIFGESRTTTQFVLAWGFNQALENGSLSSLDNGTFEGFGSRFFEWGVTWNTRIAKENPLWRIKYGMSFVYNNLNPRNNQYFVQNGELTELAPSPERLIHSRFRTFQMIFPLHLELDFSKKKETDQALYISSQKDFRIGLGVYHGLSNGGRQVLKYRGDDGLRIRERQRGDFNTSNFIYGLSGYIGYGLLSLYAKYDLNPLFRNQPTDLHNISMGIRLDLH